MLLVEICLTVEKKGEKRRELDKMCVLYYQCCSECLDTFNVLQHIEACAQYYVYKIYCLEIIYKQTQYVCYFCQEKK